jgi:hypothetical protein
MKRLSRRERLWTVHSHANFSSMNVELQGSLLKHFFIFIVLSADSLKLHDGSFNVESVLSG